MKIWSAPSGDGAHIHDGSMIMTFAGPRTVISTSPFNGGLRRDLDHVFNHHCRPDADGAYVMRAPTYEEHLTIVAAELGLDPARCAGLSTAASMDGLAIISDACGSATVTAFATGGVEVNACRPGDPAGWDEEAGLPSHRPGTINVILHFTCDLSDGALARALITLTEAKTAALHGLAVGSRCSHGLATGTGTDGAIVVADPGSSVRLTDVGGHSRLGETVGRVACRAVEEALMLQTMLGPERQHDALRRLERFGLTVASLWDRWRDAGGGGDRARFLDALYGTSLLGDVVAGASLCAQMMDELEHGMLMPGDVGAAAGAIVDLLSRAPVPCAPLDAPALIERVADALLRRVEEAYRGQDHR